MKESDILLVIGPDGAMTWRCWCGRAVHFVLRTPSKQLCECGKLWEHHGDSVSLRPTARRAVVGPDDEIMRDENGEVIWGWFEQNADGTWA